MASPEKTSTPGTPNGRKRKIDYKPMEVDVAVVEKLRVTNQILNNEADGGINFNRNWKFIKKISSKIVKNTYIQAVMGLLSVFTLFAADIAILINGDRDIYAGFELGLTISLFVFLTDVVLNAIADQQYFKFPKSFVWEEGTETYYESLKRRLSFGSWHFYFELVGALTILIDLTWAVGEVANANAGIQVADRFGSGGRIVRLMRVLRFFNVDRYISNCTSAAKGSLRALRDGRASGSGRGKMNQSSKDGKGDRPGVRFEIGEEHKEEFNADRVRDANDKLDGDAMRDGPAGEDVENRTTRSRSSSMSKKKADAPTSEEAKEGDVPADSTGELGTTDQLAKQVRLAVIGVVIGMLIFIPLLTVNDPDTSHLVASSMIHVTAYDVYTTTATTTASYTQIQTIYTLIDMQATPYLESQIRSEKPKLPIIEVAFSPSIPYSGGRSLSLWSNSSYGDEYVREIDKMSVEKVTGTFTTTYVFDKRSEVSDQARQSAITTCFVMIILFFFTYKFLQTVNKYVIDPINTMVTLVEKIIENPLGVDYDKTHGAQDGFADGMETTKLLNTINKIGSLMRVGFGEAGASIIADNLKNSQKSSQGASLNLMGAGRLIHSIFGFCDVRQFTDTTECLQEEVMLFVNRIAHILHSIVNQCSGSANKNIGDAFLLTWKLEDDMTADDQAFLADQALLTFCKALVELGRYQDFICNFSKAANDRLYARFPGYLVRIGSGLHVGWAIEGAIGSNRKIDASYLSPHVNFTEYLESSTKAYGVPLLMSEPFYNLLSEESMLYVRKVDRVRTNPAEAPVTLYTYDSDLSLKWPKKKINKPKRRSSAMKAEPGNRRASVAGGVTLKDDDTAGHKTQGKKRRQSMHSQLKEDSAAGGDLKGASDVEAGGDEPKEELPEISVKSYDFDVWEKDPELIQLRHVAYEDPKFRPLWDNGIAAYLAGDWPTAHHIFNDCLELTNNKCGPSKFLLSEIASNGGIAPDDWDGYRVDF